MNIKFIAIPAIAIAGFGLAACGSQSHVAVKAAPSSSAPAAAATQAPAPVATTTAPVPPPAPVVHSYSGYSDWNSPEFDIPSGSTVSVQYSYWNNNDGNFIAELDANGDMNSIANTIGTSGGTTTSVYPNVLDSGGSYHLEITATGSWSVKITVTTPSTSVAN